MTEHIPLNKLILSPRNVRKTNGEEDIESLADSIHSKGLLQNLVVSPAAGSTGKNRKYAVDAGGRRYRALKRNVTLGRIAANHPIPCHIIASDDGLEASLAENLQKIAMNPADEVEAFAAIITAGGAGTNSRADVNDTATRIANCARRFGRTENYVRQRLRLASLAPEILDALRAGKITIESARAYAGHPDPKVQLKIFAANDKKPQDWAHDPKSVRDALAGKVYAIDHRLVRYVGLETYVEAGGRVETDLFFGEGEREQLLDPAIIDSLAKAKAEQEAQEKAQADGWLDGVVAPVTGPTWQDPTPPVGYVREFRAPDDVEEAARAQRVTMYRLNEDGSGVERLNYTHYVPETPAEEEDKAGHAQSRHDIDYAARERRERIELYAARMAAPSISGTPLEDRAFWPVDEWDELEFVDEDDGTRNAIVTLLIKVPVDELQPHMEAAEQKYEARQAEKQRIEERIEDLESQGLHEAAHRLRTTGSGTAPDDDPADPDAGDPGDPDGGEEQEQAREDAPAEDEQVAA